MRKKCFIYKNSKKQELLYLILIGLAIISFLCGVLFIFALSKSNLLYIKDNIPLYFDNLEVSITSFFKCLFNNYIYLIIIWILGISIIGLPVVLFMFIFKSFIFGFSLSCIFYVYGINGILISILNILINKTIYQILLILITFYSVNFSIRLFKMLFLKKSYNIKESMNKYVKVLIFSLVITIFISLYEGIISNYLLIFFNI